jgi:hypothetical protein
MQCDKKSLIVSTDASKKLNLMAVGGYTDNIVDLFEECWSESIIKNGLSPSLGDDPLFRNALVTTARMGQSPVCVGKGTTLGKRDTTLSHRQTFSRKNIPETDKRLDEEDMSRLKPRMKKVGGTLMSDG